jgi:diguanylate cyclase (GGDEF)-like protein
MMLMQIAFGGFSLGDRARRRLSGLLSVFALPVGDPDLARSQLESFSKQIPLLYIILTFNAVALAATHLRVAPPLLTLAVPLILCGACYRRLIYWRRLDVAALDQEQTIKKLRTTMYLVALLGAAFTAWSLCLFPYGGPYTQFHVAYYMSITVISCILCLMHLRGAALALTGIVLIPFTIFFMLTGNLVLIAIAVNMILVTIGLIIIMFRNYDDFSGLIRSRKVLLDRQREMQTLSDENRRIAYTDSLTGLPNRRQFLATLDQSLSAARRAGLPLAVALLDLDGFKSVNDVYGHAAGDGLLIDVGQRLERVAGSGAFLARLGGDEFGVILTAFSSTDDILAFGQDMLDRLRMPCLIRNTTVAIAGSIGVAIYPDAGQTAEELFERADYALYHVKLTEKGQIVIFSDAHERVVRRKATVEQALRRADLAREMALVFQPIVDIATNRLIAFEALARWDSPDLPPIGPDVFLPIAERLGMIGELTETLLAKALHEARTWPRAVSLCFNLSAFDLMRPNTMANVQRMVLRSGVEPQRIEFEITETAAMEDLVQVAETIRQLHEFGSRVSLDDFGTGFSSLGHIHRLRLDKIKVDSSFVRDIDRSDTGPSIVRSIVALGAELGMEVIVEGVETETQRRILEGLGCRLMQGYLFGRPVPAGSVARLIAESEGIGAAADTLMLP